MQTNVLEAYNLSSMEIELYETLLALGDVPVVDVIKAVGRHPQVVYRLLDRLASHGLVLSDVRQHRRFVRAEDPEAFVKLQEDRLKQLREFLPQLTALRRKPKEATVRIQRGKEAIRSLRRRAFEELPPGGMYYILSASGTRFYQVMEEGIDRIEKRRVERGVRKRLLAFESQRTFLKREERWGLSELRFLPETFDVPSSTNIYADTVAIVIWSEEPILILIESKEVAKSYKDYFQSLWRVAKK